MNDTTLQGFRKLADAMIGEANWQWIGPHASQRMFGITRERAEGFAAAHGGEAKEMEPILGTMNRALVAEARERVKARSAEAASYPQPVRDAFLALSFAQEKVESARRIHGELPSAAYQRRVAGLKAAQTKASKRFARACYSFGFEDAQAVADILTKERQA